ncbi:MAG: hypothetical protein OHK0013_03690 [Sandaracinaceae bacterium]
MRTLNNVILLSLSLGLATLGASASFAQAQARPPTQDFSTLRFSPSVGPGNYFQVDGARVHGELEGSAGVTLDYAHNPMTIYPAACDPDGTNCQVIDGARTEIVSYTFGAHLWGAIAISRRVQIGLVLPLVGTQGQLFEPIMGVSVEGGGAFTLADPRLHVKANLLDDGSGLRLGLAAFVTAPIGHAIAPGRYIGDETPTFGGHAIVEFARDGFRIAANVGGLWRDGQRLFSTQATSQLTYAAAMGYDITPLVGVFGEVVGGTSFSGQVDENPLEARLGGRLRFDDFQIDLAGGAGLIAGLGVPVFRVLGGFAWAPMRADGDGDGLNDDADSCPGEAEDVDDYADQDGCPDPDNDQDNIPDEVDQCRDDAEDMDGEADTDGCPDRDTDGDGIQDGYDSCPSEPEDRDGDRDDDGCPDNDRDHDNINDDVDRCPNEPEDTDGYGDDDGCPETDFDGDNLPDDGGDSCPDQAEDTDGFEDEDGCPEEGGPPAEEPAAGGRRRGRGR